jgi:hypothetical protein
MRTYLATIAVNGIDRNITLLAVNVWQAVAVIRSRYVGATIEFIETI